METLLAKPQSITSIISECELNNQLPFPASMENSIRSLISGRIKKSHPKQIYTAIITTQELDGELVKVLLVTRIK